MSIRFIMSGFEVLSATTADAGAQTPTDPVSIRTVFCNMQSGNSDNALLASQIEAKQHVAIWGFSEVDGQSALAARHAAAERGGNARYEAVLGLGSSLWDRLKRPNSTLTVHLDSHPAHTASAAGNSTTSSDAGRACRAGSRLSLKSDCSTLHSPSPMVLRERQSHQEPQ